MFESAANLYQYEDEQPMLVALPQHVVGSLDDQVIKKNLCNCKRSNCLKLYCECFAGGAMCVPERCRCIGCYNNMEYETARNQAVEATLERNPNAFWPKVVLGANRHHKGCHCKKSNCLKKYCECYQAGILCSEKCRCLECRNNQDNRDAEGPGGLGGAAPVLKLPLAAFGLMPRKRPASAMDQEERPAKVAATAQRRGPRGGLPFPHPAAGSIGDWALGHEEIPGPSPPLDYQSQQWANPLAERKQERSRAVVMEALRRMITQTDMEELCCELLHAAHAEAAAAAAAAEPVHQSPQLAAPDWGQSKANPVQTATLPSQAPSVHSRTSTPDPLMCSEQGLDSLDAGSLSPTSNGSSHSGPDHRLTTGNSMQSPGLGSAFGNQERAVLQHFSARLRRMAQSCAAQGLPNDGRGLTITSSGLQAAVQHLHEAGPVRH